MRKYLAFFRLRFSMDLQYRAAAFAGVITQFAWGTMEILMFRAFYQADASAFPMSFQATASYVWMQQAFLALFMAWMMENDIFDAILNGNIAYELCRPINIYRMWFARSLANRFAKALLRCLPILLTAMLLPAPYGLMMPVNPEAFLLFFLTLLLGTGVTVSFCMLIYMTTFFTISPMAIRMIAISGVEFLSGAVIPLPFFPDKIRHVLELLPFASMQNVPLRIYSGDLTGACMWQAVFLQVFWLAALTLAGEFLNMLAMKRITVQGG